MQNRKIYRWFVPLAALAACSTSRPPAPLESATVVVVRHAEKSPDGDDPRLTEVGERRANRLAGWLRATGITRIYSTDTRRTRATAAPLSAASGIPITSYADARDLAGQLAADPRPGATLVVGHSNTIPDFVSALGGALDGLDANGNIAPDDYDRVVLLTLCGSRDHGAMRAVSVLELRMPVGEAGAGR